MIPLSPHLLVAAANSFIGLDEYLTGERSAGGGPLSAFLRRTSGLESRGDWNVAAIHHWGYWSHFDHRSASSSWPLPGVESASALGAVASALGILRDHPHTGDILLHYGPSHRTWRRAGVVAHIEAVKWYGRRDRCYDVLSIEGACDPDGEVAGHDTIAIVRRVSASMGDRFVRWVDLDDRASHGSGQLLTDVLESVAPEAISSMFEEFVAEPFVPDAVAIEPAEIAEVVSQ